MSHLCIKPGTCPKRGLFLDLVAVKVQLPLRVIWRLRSPEAPPNPPDHSPLTPGMALKFETPSRHGHFVYLRVCRRLRSKIRNWPSGPSATSPLSEALPLRMTHVNLSHPVPVPHIIPSTGMKNKSPNVPKFQWHKLLQSF